MISNTSATVFSNLTLLPIPNAPPIHQQTLNPVCMQVNQLIIIPAAVIFSNLTPPPLYPLRYQHTLYPVCSQVTMSGHRHCTQSSNPSTSKKARMTKDGTIKSLFSSKGGNIESLKLSTSMTDVGFLMVKRNTYFFTKSPTSMKMTPLLLLKKQICFKGWRCVPELSRCMGE